MNGIKIDKVNRPTESSGMRKEGRETTRGLTTFPSRTYDTSDEIASSVAIPSAG
jgi:hypothetical protein